MTLDELLFELRQRRGFDVEHALAAKLEQIAGYFGGSGLDAAVVGVSGGVDSALVLALLQACKALPESPLRRVVAILAPIGGRGATGQAQALARGRAVVEALGAEAWACNLSGAQQAYVDAFASHAASSPWAEGQLLSVARTPAFYYAAALLQQAGHRSLVVGTTNRDEGAYLGFFGKASDAMVDLQPVSDLHKSEIRALARRLEVPDTIVDATARGDVFDGRTDEEMIGAPYWFVELYLLLREHQPGQLLGPLAQLDPDERARFDHYAAAIEALHAHNAHKYRVGSPAVHLDVYPRAVPGGWT